SIERPAKVSWTIVDSDGNTVRHGLTKKKNRPGAFIWSWNGMSDAGTAVPDGYYRAMVSANTSAWTLAYPERIYVGAFRISFSAKLARGHTVQLDVNNTELLKGPVTLTFSQKGKPTITLTMRKTADYHQAAALSLAKAAHGWATISVSGTDI